MSTAAEAELTAQKDGELASLRLRVENLNSQLSDSRERCSQLEKETQALANQAQEAQDKYSAEVTAHSQIVQSKIDSLQLEHKSLEETSRLEKEALSSRNEALSVQLKSYDDKVAEVSKLNDILQDQLQELGVKVSVLDSPSMSSGGQSVVGESFRESDKLLEVLRYMRKEKSTALTQCETLRSDKLRLEADVEVLRRQLEETRKALEDERNKTDVPSIIAERHTKLLHKVEMLNELSESNRTLLEERERLNERLTAQEEEARRIEAEVISPARTRTNELASRVDQLQTENLALKAESSRWQQRANQLIERSNKTSPEDLKRLTQEKENLAKQLNLEREQLKTTKTKFEEQVSADCSLLRLVRKYVAIFGQAMCCQYV
ncbi:hypothetical protein AAG570_011618 [Ranatra chinensis]|uniref:Nucleoprotein TPR n=1 Tax=Ranatra chinensis TaxID=642074 RepID=A0ABD0Z7E3_9HEMI